MKIIDILNKIANGTLEDEFTFAYDNKVFEYDRNYNMISNKNNGDKLGYIYKVECILNDEVELIQNDEIEVIEDVKEIKEITNPALIPPSTTMIVNKINELVRAVNELRKGKE